MVGENIKKIRNQKGFTQAALAEKLFVTAQAVSRWENGEVEPSISTIKEIARIFEVSIDDLLDNPQPKAEPQTVVETQTVVEKEYVVREQKPVLAVCETCNKPIYDGGEIVRETFDEVQHVYCRSCVNEKNAKIVQQKVKKSRTRRIWSFVLGGIALAIGIIAGIVEGGELLVPYICGGVLAFTYISCLLFANNFIPELTMTIFSWGFVKMPGIIFNLSLDGLIWLLTVKLLFWVIGIVLAIAFGILAIGLGAALSVFVYPFALIKNIKNPAAIDL